jgi:hypothetical protein
MIKCESRIFVEILEVIVVLAPMEVGFQCCRPIFPIHDELRMDGIFVS